MKQIIPRLPVGVRARRNMIALLLAIVPWLQVSAADRYWPPIADPPTNEHRPGKWVWAELLTRDVARAAEFYAKVFNWTYETYGPEDDLQTYTLIFADGVPIGGMVFADPPDPKTLPNARWVGLLSVADVDAATQATRSQGGKVIVSPVDAGSRGRLALLADPEGGLFGILRSSTGDPEDYLAEVHEWLWFELWADDPEGMGRFYQSVADYRIETGATTVEHGRGLHLVAGGLPRAGVLAKTARVPTTWIPYVRVASVTETVQKARAAGAAIVIEPMTARGTQVALLLDPTGAPIAVAEWPPRENQS